MTYIHRNINSGLLMLITFISVALVATTVYGVTAFDSIAEDNFTMQDELTQLQIQLDDERSLNVGLQRTADLNQKREEVIAGILEQERQSAADAPDTKVITVSPTSRPQSRTAYSTGGVFNPYRQPSKTARTYWGYTPRKTYSY